MEPHPEADAGRRCRRKPMRPIACWRTGRAVTSKAQVITLPPDRAICALTSGQRLLASKHKSPIVVKRAPPLVVGHSEIEVARLLSGSPFASFASAASTSATASPISRSRSVTPAAVADMTRNVGMSVRFRTEEPTRLHERLRSAKHPESTADPARCLDQGSAGTILAPRRLSNRAFPGWYEQLLSGIPSR